MTEGRDTTPIFGRQRELRRLSIALREGRSVWVHGAAGVGKSALVRVVAASWDPEHEQRILLYAGDCATRRAMLRGLLESLFGTLAVIRSPGAAAIRSQPQFRRFVSSARRRELNAALHESLAGRPTIRVLDHLDAHGARLETHVENLLFESTPVVLVTDGRFELGPLERLLFAFESLEVGPISRTASLELAARWLPGAPDRARRVLVRRAGGNPGRLRELARRARSGKYWLEERLNLRLLEMDAKLAAIARRTR